MRPRLYPHPGCGRCADLLAAYMMGADVYDIAEAHLTDHTIAPSMHGKVNELMHSFDYSINGSQLWESDEIQFPRLLAEIAAIDLTIGQTADICDSMDILDHELAELFERAQARWEVIKAVTT